VRINVQSSEKPLIFKFLFEILPEKNGETENRKRLEQGNSAGGPRVMSLLKPAPTVWAKTTHAVPTGPPMVIQHIFFQVAEISLTQQR